MTTERKLSQHALALPICSGEQVTQDAYTIKGDVLGTCSGIGGPYLITAAHVVKSAIAAQPDARVMLLDPDTNFFAGASIIDAEILHADIGIIRIDPKQGNLWFGRAPWRRTPLSGFERVRALGYPYGLHVVDGRQTIVLRSFEGHSVAHVQGHLLKEVGPPPFSGYELSFAAPRGLSGGPLFVFDGGTVHAYGVVIGNSKSSMLVFDSEEKITEGDGQKADTTIVERYESLSLGLAVDFMTIGELQSKLLGTTIGGFLAANGLLEA